MGSSVYDSGSSRFNLVKTDIAALWTHRRVWIFLAISELAARFGRSFIGIGWSLISFVLFCIAIMLLFDQAAGNAGSDSYSGYVITGFLVYSLLSSLVSEACGVFISNERWLKSMNLPYGVFVFKGIAKAAFIFGLNFIATIFLLIFIGALEVKIALWSLVPAVTIILINGLWINLFLGVISARYPDFGHFVQTVMRFALFVTPILWKAGSDGVRAQFAKYNPFTYFIEIFREPLLHGTVPTFAWMLVLLMTFTGWVCAMTLYIQSRKKLIYWI